MSEEIAEAAGLIEEIARLRADNAELRASAELIHRQWRSMVAERAGLRQQLDLAEAEIATLRDVHAAVLAWLDVRGPSIAAAWRDELREALNVSPRP